MTLIKITPHLHTPPEQYAYANTYKGQAHIAVGPEVCVKCKYYMLKIPGGRCAKAKQFFGKWSVKFSPTARACKYFEPLP